VALALAAAVWFVTSDRVTSANAARITQGMPLADVNRLIHQQGLPGVRPFPAAGSGENHYVWEGMRGSIHVAFRGDLTATDRAIFSPGDSVLARTLDWLGW
jgi:hypothetical protein